MKKLVTILSSLSFLMVGSLLLAQNTSSQTSSQSETKAKTTTESSTGKKTKKSKTGSVSGEVTKYEEGKSITVKGPKGEKTVDIDASTKVTAKDVKEGSKVRVSWKETDGKEVATRVSSVVAKKSHKTSTKKSSESKTETSTTSEPAPKTN